jgi:hypothetical protein
MTGMPDGPSPPFPAGLPTSTAAVTPAGPGSAPDTATSPALPDQDNSPATLVETGAWRWYARLWLLSNGRHPVRR